jgi:hypothetical protein
LAGIVGAKGSFFVELYGHVVKSHQGAVLL